MKRTTFQKAALMGAAGLIIFTFVLYWLVYDVWRYSVVDVPHVGVPLYSGENLLQGGEMHSSIPGGMDRLDTLTVWPHVAGMQEGTVTLEISQDSTHIALHSIAAAELVEYTPYTVEVRALVDESSPIDLRFTTESRRDDGAILSFYCSKLDNNEGSSDLMTLDYYGVKDRNLTFYWIVMGSLLILYTAFCLWLDDCLKKNRKNFFIDLFRELRQYSFLMSQLVSRDFNNKYRQSILGVLWSVLNPLLTMTVMYLVFSTLFKSTVEHFAVYLLSGITMFNFFTESSSLGVDSITGNASMLNKVYVPRYIYPICRVFSSLINLLFSLIPLFIVMLISGLRFTKAFLLLPIPIILLFLFACGMSLLLSTSNVFFRDTKFLWSVVVMMWTYMTPLFYSESIIPARFLSLYHMNPMYQYIYFFRNIILYGLSPQPIIYLYSVLTCLVPLALGIWVFRKHQNKFVLYL